VHQNCNSVPKRGTVAVENAIKKEIKEYWVLLDFCKTSIDFGWISSILLSTRRKPGAWF